MDALINIFGLTMTVGSGIVAGGQIFCLVAVLPSLAVFSPEMSVKIHQEALSQRAHRYQRPVSTVGLFSAVAVLALLVSEDDRTAALVLVGAGVVMMIASCVVSSREWPINHEIDDWREAPVLDRYTALRSKWDARHQIRTVLSVVSLLLFTSATLVSREL